MDPQHFKKDHQCLFRHEETKQEDVWKTWALPLELKGFKHRKDMQK